MGKRRSKKVPYTYHFSVDIILTPALADPTNPSAGPSTPINLPGSEDPFPPSWPIDRSILNKAVKDFLRLTSHLVIPNSPTGSSTEPPLRPLGRPRAKPSIRVPAPVPAPRTRTPSPPQTKQEPTVAISPNSVLNNPSVLTPQLSLPVDESVTQVPTHFPYKHKPATTRQQPCFTSRQDTDLQISDSVESDPLLQPSKVADCYQPSDTELQVVKPDQASDTELQVCEPDQASDTKLQVADCYQPSDTELQVYGPDFSTPQRVLPIPSFQPQSRYYFDQTSPLHV
ncbi:unnamed protein product [Penicillium palitans]